MQKAFRGCIIPSQKLSDEEKVRLFGQEYVIDRPNHGGIRQVWSLGEIRSGINLSVVSISTYLTLKIQVVGKPYLDKSECWVVLVKSENNGEYILNLDENSVTLSFGDDGEFWNNWFWIEHPTLRQALSLKIQAFLSLLKQ